MASIRRLQSIGVLTISLAVMTPGLSGVQAQTRQVQIPSSYLNNLPRLWQEVMTGFYGRYDRQRKCWVARFRDDEGSSLRCMRPHKLASAAFGSSRRHFFVIGGFRINADGTDDNCFACAGQLGLIVLSEQQRRLTLVARNSLHESFGSNGQLPDENDFALRRLGPNDNYGWVVKSGVARHGTSYESHVLFGILGSAMSELGTLPAGYSDLGACEDNKNAHTGEPCTDYQFSLEFNESKATAGFSPIMLHLTGTRMGTSLNAVYTIHFSTAKRRYEVPAGLPAD